MKKTYQIVAPAAPGLPATRSFTQDVADLSEAPANSVIVVLEMTDEEFAFHTTPKTA